MSARDRTPDVLSRALTSTSAHGALDLVRTLAPHAHGPADPTQRTTHDGVVWRTSRPASGPVTLRLRQTGPLDVVADLWGPGAAETADALPALLGEADDPSGFVPPDALRGTHRRHAGVRVGRTDRVLEALVPAVLEQRVQTVAAHRAWRWLLAAHGEPAPGPAPSGLRVVPDAAGWAAVPTWDWHRAGVDPGRARTVVGAALRAVALERCAGIPLDEAYARLQALPGVGPWTAAEVALRAFGDADAVPVGDYHLAQGVVWALTGVRVPHEPDHVKHGRPPGTTSAADARMLELLAPYVPHRARVVRLLSLASPGHGGPHVRATIERPLREGFVVVRLSTREQPVTVRRWNDRSTSTQEVDACP